MTHRTRADTIECARDEFRARGATDRCLRVPALSLRAPPGRLPRSATAGPSSASGRRGRTRVSLRVGDREHELERRRLRDPRGHGRGRAGRRLRLRDRTASSSPDPATPLAAPRPARAARGCSTPAPSRGPTRASSRPRCATRCSTSCTSARSRAEGTFDAAIAHLRALRELGVTAIELMPVAAFPGSHGWGYDGVYISAAHDPYGGPPGLQRFVDAAHARGPRGAARRRLQPRRRLRHAGRSRRSGPTSRATTRRRGAARSTSTTRESDAVREWVLQSAEQWIRDFHLDGLRLDAIHAIMDSNPEHLVAAVCRRVHAPEPRAIVIAESGLNDPKVAAPSGAATRCGPTTSTTRCARC